MKFLFQVEVFSIDTGSIEATVLGEQVWNIGEEGEGGSEGYSSGLFKPWKSAYNSTSQNTDAEYVSDNQSVHCVVCRWVSILDGQ